MDETTAEERIEAWKDELELAMADQQWRRALQLCSWLRYALWQTELSDPLVEAAHHQVKEELVRQVDREKSQQRHKGELRQQRDGIMRQIASGRNEQALDSIAVLHQDGADRQMVIHLLQEIRTRMGRVLGPNYRRVNRRAALLGSRLDELEALARGA
jgi:hypothetical protein